MVFRTMLVASLLWGAAWAGSSAAGQEGTGFADLRFDARVSEALESHLKVSAERHTGVERSCDLVRSAQALVPRLVNALGEQYEAKADDAAALKRLGRQMEQADELLVGVGLRLGAETVYGYVRHDEIAEATAHADAAGLLRAVARIWRNPTGWPVYVQQQTDVTGCHDPAALVAPLEDIGRAWGDAPECVREVVAETVRQSVQEALSHASCYCATRDEVVADVLQLAGLVQTLGLGVPRPDADALMAHLQRDEVRFECLAN